MERLAREKYSGLFGNYVTTEEKSFLTKMLGGIQCACVIGHQTLKSCSPSIM
jgi:hypothetical protein